MELDSKDDDENEEDVVLKVEIAKGVDGDFLEEH